MICLKHFLGLCLQRTTRRWSYLLSVTSLLLLLPSPASGAVSLISTGAVWKYLDTGVNLGVTWRELAYDDSAWLSGPGQLGYGDNDEATIVRFGANANSKFITTYFRHALNVDNPEQLTNLNVRLLRDDGAVVYLNGIEVFRSNMPAGAIAFSTLATSAVGGADESTYFQTNANPMLLSSGLNVVAVELHQSGATSSDLGFDLALLANVQNIPPTIAITSPTNAALLSLRATNQIRILTAPLDPDGTVTRVAFFDGLQPLGEVLASPFSLLWSNAALGTHILSAVATDNAGASATSAVVSVTWVTNIAPAVAIAQPGPGAILRANADVVLQANASDGDGRIERVEFFEGPNFLGSDVASPYTLVWSNAPPGTFQLTVRATDDSGETATSPPVTITLDPNVFVPSQSVWQYLDSGANLGSAWTEPAYNDASWPSGRAQLGYGDGDESTVVSFGPDANMKFVTTYFRHAFPIAEPSSYTNLQVRLVRDDGGVVYLNGTEIFRSNMPTGAVAFSTLAPASVGGADENAFFSSLASARLLIPGENVVAVEIHQNTRTSSDLGFDLFLRANVSNAPPNIQLTQPAPGDRFSTNAPVTFLATASDPDAAIDRVEFFVNDLKVGEANDSPFQFQWPNPAPGHYLVHAQATDKADASRATTAIPIEVLANFPPSISWIAPTNDTVVRVGTDVLLRTLAADVDGSIERVEFYAGDLKLGQSTLSPYNLSWIQPPLGIHALHAVAIDDGGASQASPPVLITITTNLAPSVQILSPLPNALLSAREPIIASILATDRDGQIAQVELYLGSVRVGATTDAPYQIPLPNLAAGHYLLQAHAIDDEGGRRFSSTVQISLHQERTLIPSGATWKYLDNGTDQQSAWTQLAFNDLGWASGSAPLGYGVGSEATTVSFGPDANNKYITTYFRHGVTLDNPSLFSSLRLRLQRDDGAVVFLNGTEVFRSNMPSNPITYQTPAAARAEDADEQSRFHDSPVNPGLLVQGQNLIAVEVHQVNGSSSDIRFDLELLGSDTLSVLRGPYLQLASPTSITVRWRTDAPSSSRVLFGTDPNNLLASESNPNLDLDHVVTLANLTPDTRYYYAVGTTTSILAAGPDLFFTTFPAPGDPRPKRIWILGDSGTANANARATRDAYHNFNGTNTTDLCLMLGDNAYTAGTDQEFQTALFDMFPTTLKQVPLYPIISNHDVASLVNPPSTLPYFQIFSLPHNAQAGGIPSGTEHYYSFDFGNIHFVCLDTWSSDVSSSGPMTAWLRRDLAANTNDWLIVTGGNPPYGKLANNTDTRAVSVAVRTNLLPILEENGLDLYFAGDTHVYERSFLLDRHYGLSDTLAPSMILHAGSGNPAEDGPYDKGKLGSLPHRGAVYVIAGCAGQLDAGTNRHPANPVQHSTIGSVVLDVSEHALQVQFLAASGSILDTFTLSKPRPRNRPPQLAPTPLTTPEDHALPFQLQVSDPDSDPVQLRLLTLPNHGHLALAQADGSLVLLNPGLSLDPPFAALYLPFTNFYGADSFIVRLSDDDGGVSLGTATLLIEPVNDLPVPMASVTPSIAISPDNLHASVTLDASFSYDIEGDLLSFRWFDGDSSSPIALGSPATGVLPIGTHQLRLEVHDGTDTALANVPVTILSAGQAVESLLTTLAQQNIARQNLRPLVASLKASIASFDRGLLVSGVNQLQAVQNKTRAQLAPRDPALAETLLTGVQQIIDVVSGHGEHRTQPIPDATPWTLLRCERPHGNALRLTFSSVPGVRYSVQASTNLRDWRPVGLAQEQAPGLYEFEDSQSHALPTRYYRITEP